MQRQVQELLDRVYVRHSMSPCLVLTLLVPKNDGTWHKYIDSRAIKKTIKCRYHIPRLDDTVDELHGSCVFSKTNIGSGYHRIRMKEWDM